MSGLSAGLLAVAALTGSGAPVAVPATLQPLTTDGDSPVAHDTEVMALTAHAGRLFAATDQWQRPSAGASGQVLMKASAASPWRLFERTQSTRVQALRSFAVPGHSLLVTQAIVVGRSRIQWLLDGARAFTPRDSFALASTSADVRAFGAHESGGAWAVYAGVNPTGILRGTWSPRRRTLVFDARPELAVAPPASPGLKTQKVTGFADCAGALYVTINTRLFRRNDGPLPAGTPRWTLVYQAPPAGPRNSGLRGLTCIAHAGAAALLVSTEGSGDIYRFHRLPRERLSPASLGTPTLEWSPAPALRQMLAGAGTAIAPDGINYVIAAYNDAAVIRAGGHTRQAIGLEWRYRAGCPPARVCQPTGYDASACFALRADTRSGASYALRCLGGPELTPTGHAGSPVRAGQAFVSVRTIAASPFGDGRVYFGGYDCNFFPADGTAWIATAREGDLR